MKHSLNKLALFVSVILFLAIAACKEPIDPPPPPVITTCFTLQNDTFMDPRLPVQFLNCSQGATGYRWHFGDETVSTLAEPAHLYADTGRYDVLLEALNGDSYQMFTKHIRVDYPRFKKIRVVRMPVMNPRNGLPWDPDGSGLDITVSLTKAGDHGPTLSFNLAQNVTLPHEFLVGYDISIESLWWQFELDCWGSGTRDTVGMGTLNFQDLMNASIEYVSWDSNLVEIIMEGAR